MSFFFPKQVTEKCSYYAGAEWTAALQKANEWVTNCYKTIGKPFRVHMMYNYIAGWKDLREVILLRLLKC